MKFSADARQALIHMTRSLQRSQGLLPEGSSQPAYRTKIVDGRVVWEEIPQPPLFCQDRPRRYADYRRAQTVPAAESVSDDQSIPDYTPLPWEGTAAGRRAARGPDHTHKRRGEERFIATEGRE